ncbi:hypothetical protein C8T65DRAFT_694606 [Cerioporus squamosus]|nr:hypothetical protein C8T65DRAFT_694606 [Cerioporus squamosus]
MPRSTSKLKAWDIYAKELGHLGYGYPLWVPEPSPESGEVRLGDVGYLSQGKFCFLFNCMRGVDDPVNRNGVPEGFKLFVPPDGPGEESAKTIRNYIMDPILLCGNAHSTTVNLNASLRYELAAVVYFVAADVSFSAGTVAQGEGTLSYEVKQKTGAYLALNHPAHQTSLHCTESVSQYLRAHHAKWQDYAIERRGRWIKTQHILFVTGFVKTAMWAVGAFRHGSSSATLKIDAGAMFTSGLSASTGAAISVADCNQPIFSHRKGPAEGLPWKDGVLHPDDQCIFLQYAHLKPRFVLSPEIEFCSLKFECVESSREQGSLHEHETTVTSATISTPSRSLEQNEGAVESIVVPPEYAGSDCDSEDMHGQDDSGFSPVGGGDEDDSDGAALEEELNALLEVRHYESDGEVVDEEALDYILQHCSDSDFACASSQDLYVLCQVSVSGTAYMTVPDARFRRLVGMGQQGNTRKGRLRLAHSGRYWLIGKYDVDWETSLLSCVLSNTTVRICHLTIAPMIFDHYPSSANLASLQRRPRSGRIKREAVVQPETGA